MAALLSDAEVFGPMARTQAAPSPALLSDEDVFGPMPSGPREVSPVIAGIQDDRSKAAPARVIANASLFPNLKDRIPVFAKAMNIPPERFAIADGDIVYADEKNPNVFYRVEPSVIGARSPADALGRVGSYVAGSVGPAIPAAAGIGAGIATSAMSAPVSIAAATAASGAGDAARQALGRFINGGDPTQIDWENVAGQAALGGIGQGVGRGIEALYNRAPAGMAAADKAWFRNPANVAQARANADLLRREGITAMQGPITNRGSLIHADRQMMRNANTADPMRETVRRINLDEVPTAAEGAASRIAPNRGVDVTARTVQEAAEPVIEAPRVAGNAAATPFYRQAEAGAQAWTPELAQLADNYPAVQSALKRAGVTYQNLYGKPAPSVPDFRMWDLAKKQLDADFDAAGSAVLPAERAARAGIDTARKRLVSALDDLYPTYATGKAVAQPGMQASARLREGVLGDVAKVGPDKPAGTVLGKLFDPGRTSPAAIAETRQAFEAAGKLGQFEEGFAAYVRSVADTAQKALANGDTGNVAGKIHAELFSTEAKRNAVAAALGGRNTPAYQQFAETMRAFEIASRIPVMGSPTATDAGQIGAVASPAARTVAAPLRLLSPSTWANWGNRLADAIETRSASNAALRTATNYAAGPNMNGAMMEGIRIMNPALAGLLTAGARGGAGLLAGMLPGAPSETGWQPYQPPLPRP